MRKIICPRCGEIKYYGLLEKCHHTLILNRDGRPCGGTELIVDWNSNVPRCLYCNRKVKFIEEED